MTYSNRKDILVNGKAPDTIKSRSPCAYRSVNGTPCHSCNDYALFEGVEAVLLKNEQELV